jgi:hypothetical protein
MQVPVLGIGVVTPHAINRDSKKLRAVLAEVRQQLVVERELIPADGTPVGRVEGNDDWLAAKVAKRELLIGRNGQREIRRSNTGGQYRSHLLTSQCRIKTLTEASAEQRLAPVIEDTRHLQRHV